MPLSRIEIRRRATAFAKEWADASDEDAQAKTFWYEFFAVFGLKPQRVGSFEVHVKKLRRDPGSGPGDGFIDFFWPGTLIVEHKSRGKDLAKAHQALDKAVDKCYRPQPFPGSGTGLGDAKRVEYLFELYEKYTQGLLAGVTNKRTRKA